LAQSADEPGHSVGQEVPAFGAYYETCRARNALEGDSRGRGTRRGKIQPRRVPRDRPRSVDGDLDAAFQVTHTAGRRRIHDVELDAAVGLAALVGAVLFDRVQLAAAHASHPTHVDAVAAE